MNWVQKYYLEVLADAEDEVTIRKLPFFLNGIEIKDYDADIRTILYQEPLTNIVASLILVDGLPIEKARFKFDLETQNWRILNE